jgi:hypothetical protein
MPYREAEEPATKFDICADIVTDVTAALFVQSDAPRF